MEEEKLLLIVKLSTMIVFMMCASQAKDSDRREIEQIVNDVVKKSEIYKEEVQQKALEARKIVQQAIDDGEIAYHQKKCQIDTKESNSCTVLSSNKRAAPIKQSASIDGDKIIVFVSLSMPEAALKGLFKELEYYKDVKLVLRGLMEDSIQKTAQKINDLGGVLDVDPQLFEKYHIEHVPTFVQFKNNQPVAKLSGNVTIGFALEKFAQKTSMRASS